MSKSDDLIDLIRSFYTKPVRLPYETLKAKHESLIASMGDVWVDVNESVPKDGERVFVIEDLRPTGRNRGRFVDYFYYVASIPGFVAELGDDDPYGYITHWVSFDTIDKGE